MITVHRAALVAAVILVHSLVSAPAAAAGDEFWLVLGPGAGRIEDGSPGGSPVYSVDITMGNEATSSNGIISLGLPQFWVSGGVRAVDGDEDILMPYGEVGVWFILAFGAGCSRIFGGNLGDYAVNLFLGMPVPLKAWEREGHFIMAEPYYRYYRTVDGGFREFGVLVKYGNRLFD
ncbi:MAG: hypothetical protein KBA61_01975 [Spirochaetes bacterium]|nr:hypothetical protein [Spirochaetota bacterium]